MTKPDEKRQNLMTALVEAYGEGAVIDRAHLLKVYKQKTRTKAMRERMPHPVAVERNDDLKIKRNRYVVTTSSDPAGVKQAIVNQQKLLGFDEIRITA